MAVLVQQVCPATTTTTTTTTMSPSAFKDAVTPTDTIETLSEPLSSMTSLSPLVNLLALTYRIKSPSPSKQDRLSSLMYTISTLDSCSKEHAHDEFRNSFVRLLSPVLNGMASLQEFEDAVGAATDPENFRDFWTLEGRNLIKEFVQDRGATRGTSPGADLPFLETFVGDASCRVALTKGSGQLVLVSGDCKAEDCVSPTLVLNHGMITFRDSRLE